MIVFLFMRHGEMWSIEVEVWLLCYVSIDASGDKDILYMYTRSQ